MTLDEDVLLALSQCTRLTVLDLSAGLQTDLDSFAFIFDRATWTALLLRLPPATAIVAGT